MESQERQSPSVFRELLKFKEGDEAARGCLSASKNICFSQRHLDVDFRLHLACVCICLVFVFVFGLFLINLLLIFMGWGVVVSLCFYLICVCCCVWSALDIFVVDIHGAGWK